MPRLLPNRPLLTATALVGALAMVPITTSAMAAVDSSTVRQFDRFLDVYNRIKADYVDKVDDDTLIKGAIQGCWRRSIRTAAMSMRSTSTI